MIQSSAYLLFACAVLGLSLGCQIDERDPTVGSETHFLTWCSQSGSCQAGLECICGVCALACEESRSCADLSPEATCVSAESPSCTSASEVRTCDVPCDDSDDCLILSAEHRCDLGHCRRLSEECERGTTGPNEVIFLGDNFLADNGQIVPSVQALAEVAGSLVGGASYRDYSSTLTTPFGGAMDLSSQFAIAREDGVARVVVLDAGGPDALLNCPEPVTAGCPALQNAVTGFAALLVEFEQGGVAHVIAFFYPDPDDQNLKAKFDVLRPLMKDTCEGTSTCSFIDLRSTFTGSEDQYLLSGGILPTAAGSRATAELIWSEMSRRCVAQ